MSLVLESRVAQALALLREGRPVLVYDADGREEEVDLFLAAERVAPEGVRLLRREAGGLVFVAVDGSAARRLGLPFLHDVYARAAAAFPVLGGLASGPLPYDARSAFSVTLNHRATFTGVTDQDRALTIRRFAELCLETERAGPEEARRRLGEEFRSPGHVHLCLATEPPLAGRRGHTDLAAALARMAGLAGGLAGAEMLGSGRALPKTEALRWARERGTVLLEGHEVQRAWATFIKRRGDGPP